MMLDVYLLFLKLCIGSLTRIQNIKLQTDKKNYSEIIVRYLICKMNMNYKIFSILLIIPDFAADLTYK